MACLSSVLSELESSVLSLYLDGHSYEAIGGRLDCDTKTVDNALQRVKRKVGSHLDSRKVLARRWPTLFPSPSWRPNTGSSIVAIVGAILVLIAGIERSLRLQDRFNGGRHSGAWLGHPARRGGPGARSRRRRGKPEAGFEPATYRTRRLLWPLSYSGRPRPCRPIGESRSPWPRRQRPRCSCPFEDTGFGSSGSNSPCIEPSLDLGEHEAEQQMAPGGREEGPTVAGQRLEVGARRVMAVDQHSEHAAQVLGEPRSSGRERWHRQDRARERVGRAECRSVRRLDRQPGGRPAAPALTSLPSSSTSS